MADTREDRRMTLDMGADAALLLSRPRPRPGIAPGGSWELMINGVVER
jgi:hypothetical protein